jgi:hypothetical protein
MFGRRPDATLVKDLSRTQRFLPYISPRRGDSLVYFTTEIEVGPAHALLTELNRDRPAVRRITLFHLYLRAMTMAFDARPGVNRFVAGGKLWQRNGVWITFSAKQEIVDGAPVLTIKRRFDPREGIVEMVDGLMDELIERRRGKLSTADKEVNLILRLPGLLIRLGVRALSALDYLGLLPGAMLESDPMFSSLFVANLGSVGLDAGYHHLWEYGTVSTFAVVGKTHINAKGVEVMQVKYSYDERIADGLYAAITLEGVKTRLENPKELLSGQGVTPGPAGSPATAREP